MSAARGLIQISKSDPGLLQAEWQQIAKLLREPLVDSHTDLRHDDEKCGYAHNDHHKDRGIGLTFPEDPPVSAQGKVETAVEIAQATFVICCPAQNCRKRLNVPRHLAGNTARCPACGTTIQIPAQPDASPDVKRDF